MSLNPLIKTTNVTFLTFHIRFDAAHTSFSTFSSFYTRRLPPPPSFPPSPSTSCRFSAYECSNWRRSDLHGWTRWGRGNRSEGLQTQAFRGMRLCQAARRRCAHCTDVTSHTAWTKEELEGCTRITHLTTDSCMYGTVNITERAATTEIYHQSYLLTFINTKPFQRQTFSQR